MERNRGKQEKLSRKKGKASYCGVLLCQLCETLVEELTFSNHLQGERHDPHMSVQPTHQQSIHYLSICFTTMTITESASQNTLTEYEGGHPLMCVLPIMW